MKATPLLISWHNDNAPIYSVHYEPNGKGRLATAGNDNNVRLWRVESTGEERKITYLSTLVKHTQAVNVVRFSPKGEMLASAGDDGNVLLWVPSELQMQPGLGEDRSDDKETWRVKHMCRSSGAEIYDLAWSPDGVFIITGSMDNIARIYNAQTGLMVRQIAEHSHYVQGVAWDPLNEFVATQSSDRSVHIYSLKTKDGQFTLTAHGKFLKMDLPARRISSSSPAPPETNSNRPAPTSNNNSFAMASPAPSTPGTPKASHLPMDPPPVSHSRRSSFGSSPSLRRSASPAPPSLPLPAVKPLEVPSPGILGGLGAKNTNIYANETFTSFFRRLTFAPDGSLLFTPAGQYKTSHVSSADPTKTTDEIINTVYIYTRAGFNKPPISHLPGHKKPSVAVKCSPIFYTLRQNPKPVSHITLDTSREESFHSLPDPVVGSSSSTTHPSMEPPSTLVTSDASKSQVGSKGTDPEGNGVGQSPPPVFALPYRIVYAVATQDAVLVYDTQQQTPLCVVSNLHFATFTDLTWSNDGLTLIMSSSDGFCSALSFAPGELGQPYTPPPPPPTTTTTTASTAHHQPHHPLHHHTTSASSSSNNTPQPTPTHAGSPVKASPSLASPVNAHTTPVQAPARPASPARSNSVCSIATQASTQQSASQTVVNNPTPTLGTVPLVTAAHSAQPAMLPLTTPPQTPMSTSSQGGAGTGTGTGFGSATVGNTVLGKRDSTVANDTGKEAESSTALVMDIGQEPGQEQEKRQEQQQQPEQVKQPPKRRRIAPTLVATGTATGESAPVPAPASALASALEPSTETQVHADGNTGEQH